MIGFRTQVSGLELPILAELLLDVEQPDLAVRSFVPVRIGVGVGRRNVGVEPVAIALPQLMVFTPAVPPPEVVVTRPARLRATSKRALAVSLS